MATNDASFDLKDLLMSNLDYRVLVFQDNVRIPDYGTKDIVQYILSDRVVELIGPSDGFQQVNGTFVGGTVEQINVISVDPDTKESEVLFSVSDLSIPLVDYVKAASTSTLSDDFAVWREQFSGDDTFNLAGTNDYFNGFAGDDILRGRGGDDRLLGAGGNDKLLGGGGDDLLRGGSGNDLLKGGRGDDRLAGNSGSDTLKAGGGKDVLAGGGGNDRLAGGGANDKLKGGGGADVMIGGGGNDRMVGGGGNDRMIGGGGNDRMVGGGGKDTLLGGKGSDFMNGGAGADTFVFTRAGARSDVDRIARFQDDIDTLQFRTRDDFDSLDISQKRGHTVIEHSEGKIVLLKFDADDLDAGDFQF